VLLLLLLYIYIYIYVCVCVCVRSFVLVFCFLFFEAMKELPTLPAHKPVRPVKNLKLIANVFGPNDHLGLGMPSLG
jgi:hypothetical protein